jgi:hypothetical protein
MEQKIVTTIASSDYNYDEWLKKYTDKGWKVVQITSNTCGSGKTYLHLLMGK